MFNRDLWANPATSGSMEAILVLAALLVIVVGLTVACIIVPLLLMTDRSALKGTSSLSAFFACIGLGFMLIEISQMQRLVIFLGHPTYSLSVVLFALLVSSGAGSYLTRGTADHGVPPSAGLRLLLLLAAVLVFGLLTPGAIRWFQGSVTPVRVLVVVGLLLPLGLFMGMAFPLGMRLASAKSASITPWLWGINGATSICASVLAIAIAISASISTAYWAGFAAYVCAALAFAHASGIRVRQVRTVLSSPRTKMVH